MKANKDHWYDGIFYDKFIAPNQDTLFTQIINIIGPNSKIIDVGCGTGRFSFIVHDKCNSVLGIDLSKRNIDRANLLLAKNPRPNITFEHKSVLEISADKKNLFDYAVMTYVIHEVDADERVPLLNQISQIADKIIIGDYLVPRQKGSWNYLNEIVEFAAGSEHYRNYKNYVHNGGIKELANQANLKIISEIRDKPLTSHLVFLSNK